MCFGSPCTRWQSTLKSVALLVPGPWRGQTLWCEHVAEAHHREDQAQREAEATGTGCPKDLPLTPDVFQPSLTSRSLCHLQGNTMIPGNMVRDTSYSIKKKDIMLKTISHKNTEHRS